MKEVLQTATPIALIGGIVCLIGAALIYLVATRVAASRDELRKLRTALERDPSPAQHAQARGMWPIVSQTAEKLQQSEFVRHAHHDEAKLSARFEQMKGLSRVCIGFGVVFFGIYLLGTFWKPQ
jgi:hypothetical protein